MFLRMCVFVEYYHRTLLCQGILKVSCYNIFHLFLSAGLQIVCPFRFQVFLMQDSNRLEEQ